MNKVKLTKETADAIELMRAKGAPISEIVERHVHKEHIEVKGYEWVAQLSTNTLIRALYIGYEVEQTPEEKVREIIQEWESKRAEHGDRSQVIDYDRYGGRLYGARCVLEILGIRIPGVNE